MRIVVDLQGAQGASARRGIGRYSLSLTRALARECDGRHDLIVALSGMLPDSVEPLRTALDDVMAQSQIRVWEAVGPVGGLDAGNLGRIRRGECLREAFLESLDPDVVLVSSVFEGLNDDAITSIKTFFADTPVVAILYDLIPFIRRKPYLENPVVERWYLEKIAHLKRADCLLAISASARDEAIKHLEFQPDRVVTVSAAADESFGMRTMSATDEARLRERYGLIRPFVLSVGGYDYRKNLEGLIRAYASLPGRLRDSHQLAIVGSIQPVHQDALDQLVRRHGLKPNEVVFTGFAPDADLPSLYTVCKLVVLPSWHEGFGLPAIEAMRCGAPVIGADASSLPEVIGRADALFDPYSDSAIANAMERALDDEAYRVDLKRHGLERERNFSWGRCAQRTLAALECVARPRQTVRLSPERALDRLIQKLASIEDANADERQWLELATAIDRSIPPERSDPQLFVDVSELSQRDAKSGIQRVVRSILKELLSEPPMGYRVEPVYASPAKPGYRYARAFTSRFLGGTGVAPPDDVIASAPGDAFLGLDLQSDVVQAQRETLRGLRRYGVQVHFVVYDLIPVLHPHTFPDGAATNHGTWLRTVGEFDGAICISGAVAAELSEWLDRNGRRSGRRFAIRSFHLGSDLNDLVTANHEVGGVPSWTSSALSFLMVGTLEPRKMHAQALDAFEALWASGEDVSLVIAGKQGWMVDGFAKRLRSHAELGKRLFWFDSVDDVSLVRLYQSAACLLAPSIAEGFGLPLVEAARCDLPILARDIPVFREIAGPSAVYFRGERPVDLAEAIRGWLALHRQDKVPNSSAIPVCTWRQSARELTDALFEAAEPDMPDHCNALAGIGRRPGEPVLIESARDPAQ